MNYCFSYFNKLHIKLQCLRSNKVIIILAQRLHYRQWFALHNNQSIEFDINYFYSNFIIVIKDNVGESGYTWYIINRNAH